MSDKMETPGSSGPTTGPGQKGPASRWAGPVGAAMDASSEAKAEGKGSVKAAASGAHEAAVQAGSKAVQAGVSAVASPLAGRVAGKATAWAGHNKKLVVMGVVLAMLMQAAVFIAPPAAMMIMTSMLLTGNEEQQVTSAQNAQADGVVDSTKSAYQTVTSAVGVEWEILAAIGFVISEHGGAGTTGPGSESLLSGSEDDSEDEEEDGPKVWPVADEPIVEEGDNGATYLAAMLVREEYAQDYGIVDGTESSRSVHATSMMLRTLLQEVSDEDVKDDLHYRSGVSFEYQTEVYKEAIARLPLKGLDSQYEPEDGGSTGVSDDAEATAEKIIQKALSWRNTCDVGGANGASTLLATSGPINVGDTFTGGWTMTMTETMMLNAQTIVAGAFDKPFVSVADRERGQVIAISTALQESSLLNLANAKYPASLAAPHDKVAPGDHDSGGLFQQRPQAAWGTYAEVQNPVYATSAFYGGPGLGPGKGLLDLSGWQDMGLGEAAQKVQISAFPDAYDPWTDAATGIVVSILEAMGEDTNIGTGGGTKPNPTPTPAPSDDPSTSPSDDPSATEEPLGTLVSVTDNAGCGGTSTTTNVFLNFDGEPYAATDAGPHGTIMLVDVPTHHPSNPTITVAAEFASNLFSMLEAAYKDGIILGGGGYRSYQRQVELRSANGCPDIHKSPSSSCRVATARPGNSNHETGFAVDFSSESGGTICFPRSASWCAANGSGSEGAAFDWLQANSESFEYINFPVEAWHYSNDGG